MSLAAACHEHMTWDCWVTQILFWLFLVVCIGLGGLMVMTLRDEWRRRK